MKKLITTCCIAVGFLMPMAVNTTVHAQAPFEHERHGEIQGALDALEHAKFRLMHANHDFGGHREAAVHAIDVAIEQLRIAMQYDRH